MQKMIELPASLIDKLSLISLNRERSLEAIISEMEDEEPDIFNAVVVATDTTNNTHVGTAHGNPASGNPNEPTYRFARMRRTGVDEFEKPSPFLAKFKNIARKLANMHPIGVLLESGGNEAPLVGDIWSCRYLTEDRQGLVLLNRVDVSQEFLSLKTKDSHYQSSAQSWGSNRPQLLGPSHQTPAPSTGGTNYTSPGNYSGTYTNNWWIITLESIIALDSMKKGSRKCSWGKRYDEVCPVDGRGIIGIAHWTQGSLNPLVDEIVKQLGEPQIQTWFGKSSEELKRFNKKCTSRKGGNPCYDNSPWWKQGWESFVNHPKTIQIQQVTWKRKYAVPSVQALEEFGWPKTNRNLAILAGIRNSAGRGGVDRHSKNGKRGPDATLASYVNDSDSYRHRKKRADAINRVFP